MAIEGLRNWIIRRVRCFDDVVCGAPKSSLSPPLIECAARSRVIDHFQTFWISRKWDAVEFLSTPMLVHHTQRWNQTGTKGIHTHWERERERESEWNNHNSGMQMSFSVDASSYANQRPFTSLFIPFVCYTTWTDFAIQLYLNWLVGRRLMTSISLSLYPESDGVLSIQ